jgi:hypothetical protein
VCAGRSLFVALLLLPGISAVLPFAHAVCVVRLCRCLWMLVPVCGYFFGMYPVIAGLRPEFTGVRATEGRVRAAGECACAVVQLSLSLSRTLSNNLPVHTHSSTHPHVHTITPPSQPQQHARTHMFAPTLSTSRKTTWLALRIFWTTFTVCPVTWARVCAKPQRCWTSRTKA